MITLIVVTHDGWSAEFGNNPLSSLLSRSMAGLVSSGLIDVNLICNKDIYRSTVVSYNFFTVLFRNLMFVCPLVWLLYKDDTECQILNFSEVLKHF